ncbi:hypothetical protein PFISCL1PPCAC_22902, partial [Pristionchus fissidentatus]
KLCSRSFFFVFKRTFFFFLLIYPTINEWISEPATTLQSQQVPVESVAAVHCPFTFRRTFTVRVLSTHRPQPDKHRSSCLQINSFTRGGKKPSGSRLHTQQPPHSDNICKFPPFSDSPRSKQAMVNLDPKMPSLVWSSCLFSRASSANAERTSEKMCSASWLKETSTGFGRSSCGMRGETGGETTSISSDSVAPVCEECTARLRR